MFSYFLHYRNLRGCVSLKKKKSQGKAVEVTVNKKEKTLKTFSWMSKNSASRLWLFGPGVSDSSKSDIVRLAAIMTHDILASWVIT
jgi:hypothetical protein